MKIGVKAVRDVLDWRGKASREIASAEVDCERFDPAAVVRKVVSDGEFDCGDLEEPSLPGDAVQVVAGRFGGGGRKFPYQMSGTVRLAATEFVPAGFQYMMYSRAGGHARQWIKTDSCVVDKAAGEGSK